MQQSNNEVLANRLGGLSLPRKSVVRLTDWPNMTLDVYRGRKTTTKQQLLSVDQGPVVQSIVSLTSSLRGQLVKCFTTLSSNTIIFFVEKMREAHIFSTKNIGISEILMFEILTKC